MALLGRHCPGARALRSIARLALAAAAVLLLGGTRLAGQASRAPEYQLKAVFLFNFAQFVEWPPDPGADPAAPLVIGVLGEDPFGSVLDETVRGERLGQRPFRVMRYRRVEEIERCDILFISRSEARIVDDIIAQLALRPILTVAEIERFAERGGMVRFLSDRGRIRLQIQRGPRRPRGSSSAPSCSGWPRWWNAGAAEMHVRDWPITRKLAGMLLLVSTCAVLLTSAGFVISEVVRLRQAMRNNLATLAQIIAANSTAALAFASEADAREILAALKAEPQIVAAALYDRDGRLFARYPASLAAAGLPPAPGADEFRIEAGYLAGFAPVGTEGSPRLGTLYLRAELSEVPRALVRLGVIATAVVAASVLATYLLSRPLQRAFSQPVLALAGTAKGVAEHQDYSVRVPRVANDELGTLVDAFNHMLGRIQEQDAALKASKEELQRHAGRLEERVAARTRDLEDRNRELRSSEAYAVLIVEAAHDAFIAMDEEGRVAGWNHRAEETFGWTREEVLRRPLAELIIPEELRDAHRRGLERFLQTAEGKLVNRLIELTALRRDGRSFPAELTIAPLRRDGRWVFTAFVRDISERKEAEESLRRQAAELAAANEELDAFAYSVSHDLRAPLRSIDGFSQMLLEDYPDQLDDAGRDALRRVRAASQRMGMLIDDLLNLARVTRAEMNRGRVDLSAMAAGVAEELRREAPERTVEVTVAPGLTAWGDPALLRVALENLLRNCWKYTRHQPHPRVEVLAVPGDGQRTFVVRDNGAGFDMRYADKLFGAFQRLHAASEFEGTGIGLATVRRILARHGGRVWAEGTVGQGASFYFTL